MFIAKKNYVRRLIDKSPCREKKKERDSQRQKRREWERDRAMTDNQTIYMGWYIESFNTPTLPMLLVVGAYIKNTSQTKTLYFRSLERLKSASRLVSVWSSNTDKKSGYQVLHLTEFSDQMRTNIWDQNQCVCPAPQGKGRNFSFQIYQKIKNKKKRIFCRKKMNPIIFESYQEMLRWIEKLRLK